MRTTTERADDLADQLFALERTIQRAYQQATALAGGLSEFAQDDLGLSPTVGHQALSGMTGTIGGLSEANSQIARTHNVLEKLRRTTGVGISAMGGAKPPEPIGQPEPPDPERSIDGSDEILAIGSRH